MEAVFEAFVARHLARQLARPFTLRTQASSFSLVRHRSQDWFRLKPDLLVQEAAGNCLVLDTKWKLLDGAKANGSDKYGLSQADFYQLHAYGQSYLDGRGDVVLIYPRTDAFDQALPVFEFPKSSGLRLWVLPLCLQRRQLILPACGSLAFCAGRQGRRERCRCARSGLGMIDTDALASLRAENARLTALLDAHGIAWRLPPQAQTPAVAEPSRLTTDEKVALFRTLFRGRTSAATALTASCSR